jgi:hypothetical protein
VESLPAERIKYNPLEQAPEIIIQSRPSEPYRGSLKYENSKIEEDIHSYLQQSNEKPPGPKPYYQKAITTRASEKKNQYESIEDNLDTD